MLTDLEIKIDVENLNMVNNSITGKICTAFNDCYFPDINWDDFVVVLMKNWVKEVSMIERAKIGSIFILHFMDGPFLIQIEKVDEKLLRLNFLRRKINNNESLYWIDTNTSNFIRILLDAAKQIVQKCDRMKWENNDIKELKLSISILTNEY